MAVYGKTMPQHCFLTPIGSVVVREEGGALVALDWGLGDMNATPLLAEAESQIRAYFRGERRTFDLPLKPGGTSFQHRVWTVLRSLPYGSTSSYGDLARTLGTAARAIGGACGRNPLPILIPCHRVIAADGTLGGYSGPENVKSLLLDLEMSHL